MVELFSANILLNYVTGQVKVRSNVKITTFILVGYGAQLTGILLALFTQEASTGFQD